MALTDKGPLTQIIYKSKIVTWQPLFRGVYEKPLLDGFGKYAANELQL